ncbi:MAG: hypothetical protein ACTS73_09860 [Arsenophonus sp. NEOnobi-MAG3]
MRMLIELLTINVQGTEDTNFYTLFRCLPVQEGARELVGTKQSVE